MCACGYIYICAFAFCDGSSNTENGETSPHKSLCCQSLPEES